MSTFSTLKLMGLTDTDSISHYRLSHEHGQEILKVYFKRPQGSSLPNSSSFCFERNQVISADSEASQRNQRNNGSDPVLMAAIEELNSLTRIQNSGRRREILLNEIECLEQLMAAKLRELREDIY